MNGRQLAEILMPLHFWSLLKKLDVSLPDVHFSVFLQNWETCLYVLYDRHLDKKELLVKN